MEWHLHIFTELARFFSYLALVVHHPSEVCHIHPLPLQFLHSLLNTCIPESGFELYVAFNNPSNGFLRCSPALCQFKSLPRWCMHLVSVLLDYLASHFLQVVSHSSQVDVSLTLCGVGWWAVSSPSPSTACSYCTAASTQLTGWFAKSKSSPKWRAPESSPPQISLSVLMHLLTLRKFFTNHVTYNSRFRGEHLAFAVTQTIPSQVPD